MFVVFCGFQQLFNRPVNAPRSNMGDAIRDLALGIAGAGDRRSWGKCPEKRNL